jgi:hypothetical protein
MGIKNVYVHPAIEMCASLPIGGRLAHGETHPGSIPDYTKTFIDFLGSMANPEPLFSCSEAGGSPLPPLKKCGIDLIVPFQRGKGMTRPELYLFPALSNVIKRDAGG